MLAELVKRSGVATSDMAKTAAQRLVSFGCFDWSDDDTSELPTTSMIDVAYCMEPIRIELDLSHRRAQLALGEDIPAHCTLWYNGFLFLVMAEVPSLGYFSFIGQNARDWLEEQLSLIPGCVVRIIAPSPMHPDFFVTFEAAAENATLQTASVQYISSSKDVVIRMPPGDIHTLDLVAEHLFLRDLHYLTPFYRLRSLHSVVRFLASSVGRRHAAVARKMTTYLKCSMLKFWRRRKLEAEINLDLALLHSFIVEYENKLLQVDRERDDLTESLQERPRESVAYAIRDYLTSMTERPPLNTSGIVEYMRYTQSSLETRSVSGSTIIAAILGASFVYILNAVSGLFGPMQQAVGGVMETIAHLFGK